MTFKWVNMTLNPIGGRKSYLDSLLHSKAFKKAESKSNLNMYNSSSVLTYKSNNDFKSQFSAQLSNKTKFVKNH